MQKSVQRCLIRESAAQDSTQLLFGHLDITELEQHRGRHRPDYADLVRAVFGIPRQVALWSRRTRFRMLARHISAQLSR
jgi:hypothetical protein